MVGKTIAIIPARGGSKRIPKKNIKQFMGKPMIAWTIEAAINSGAFDDILVSTDSEEIAVIAQKYGASCPFLRQEAHDDLTPVSEATVAALLQWEAYDKSECGTVIQLMPNCPLRNANTIRAMRQHFIEKEVAFLLSAFSYGWANPWWAHEIKKGGAVPHFPKALTTRSQDLPTLYCPTGAIWIAKAQALKASKTFYGPGYGFYPISWQEALDIDDQEDWLMAEAVFTMQQKRWEQSV